MTVPSVKSLLFLLEKVPFLTACANLELTMFCCNLASIPSKKILLILKLPKKVFQCCFVLVLLVLVLRHVTEFLAAAAEPTY